MQSVARTETGETRDQDHIDGSDLIRRGESRAFRKTLSTAKSRSLTTGHCHQYDKTDCNL